MRNEKISHPAEKGRRERAMVVRGRLATEGITFRGYRYHQPEVTSQLLASLATLERTKGTRGRKASHNVEALIFFKPSAEDAEPSELDLSEIFVWNPLSGRWLCLPGEFPTWGPEGSKASEPDDRRESGKGGLSRAITAVLVALTEGWKSAVSPKHFEDRGAPGPRVAGELPEAGWRGRYWGARDDEGSF